MLNYILYVFLELLDLSSRDAKMLVLNKLGILIRCWKMRPENICYK